VSPEGYNITPQGLAALHAELEQLEGPERRAIAERIKTAREWGDLKENAEYHDAKNTQAHLETRIARVRDHISKARVAEPSSDDGEIRFGTQVELTHEASGKTLVYRLVGSPEADLAQGKLSIESPLAQALLGRRAGDTVAVTTPRGEQGYRIANVLP